MHEYRTNRGFRTITNATVLSSIGDSLYNIVFIIYAASLPFSSLAVSLASMAGLVPTLLGIITGYWADNTPRKVGWIMRVRYTQAALFVLLAVAISHTASVGLFLLLLLINIVSDTIGQYGNGLTIPLFKRLVPTTALNSAFGFNTAATETVQMIFQAVGASVIVILNHNYVLFGLINAATFVCSAVVFHHAHATLSKVDHDWQHVGPRPRLRTSLLSVWQLLQRNHFLLSIILLSIPANILASSVTALINLTLLHRRTLWLGNFGTTVAVVNILFSLGIVLGSLLMEDIFRRYRTLSIFALAMGCMAALGGIMSWQHSNVVMMLLAIFAMAYTIAKINPRLSAITMTLVPESQLAAMSGADTTASMIGVPIGQGLFLTITNLINTTTAWIAYAVVAAILVVVTLAVRVRLTEPTVGDEQAPAA